MNLPDLVTLGIRQTITDRFRVMAGAEWSNWSRFDTVTIKGGPAPIDLPFKYDDGWFFSAGGEFDVTQQLAVRTGVGYELGPIDDNVRTYRIPDSDRLHLSGGVSYRLTNACPSISATPSFPPRMSISARPSAAVPDVNGPFSGHADAHSHYIAAAIRAKF